jgi:hypothetical protein
MGTRDSATPPQPSRQKLGKLMLVMAALPAPRMLQLQSVDHVASTADRIEKFQRRQV